MNSDEATDNFARIMAEHLRQVKLIEQSLFGIDGPGDHPWIADAGTHGWDWYAQSYKRASDILVGAISERNGYIDELVYPIVALYRQSIELQLKHLLLLMYPNLPEDDFTTHDLVTLWKKVREQWSRYPKPDYYSRRLVHLDKRLKEFQSLDPTSQSFRYPVDTKGKSSLKRTAVNLRKMKDIANAIYIFIDQVATDIEESGQT